MRLRLVLSGAIAVVVGAAVAGAVVMAAERSDDALPSDAYEGRMVCPGAGPLAPRAADAWTYTASLSRAAGLVIRDVRFGPRLLAHSMSVPYIRIRTDDGWHRGLLTPSPRPGDDVKVSLVGQPQCSAQGGAPGASAVYSAEVGDLKFLVQQSYRFDDALDTSCEPTGTVVCHRFWPTTTWALVQPERTKDKDIVVSIVQRFEFDPDDGRARGTGGATNLVRDSLGDGTQFAADHAAHGRMTEAGAKRVLDDGKVGLTTWENYHQTSRPEVGLPGLTKAGCSECAHVHWSWMSLLVNSPEPVTKMLANKFIDFTDGKPQILDGSRQTACIGWTTNAVTSAVDWCERAKDDDRNEVLDAGRPAVTYWDARSRADHRLKNKLRIGGSEYVSGDSYWPVLEHRKHGGNGSMFFVPARSFRTVDHAPRKRNEVRLRPEWPATFKDGVGWILPVHVTLSDPEDQGPYYVRVISLGPRLSNPDQGWLSSVSGAPWVRISDDAGRPLSRYSDGGGDMTAHLTFDEPPRQGDLFLQEFDAAPDGGFGRSEAAVGDWQVQTVAYLPAIDGRTVTVDPVEYLTGPAMEQACREDGVEPGAGACEFFYARNTGEGTRRMPIAPTARVTLADYGCGNPLCPDDFEYTPPDNSVEGLARAVGQRASDGVPLLATVTVNAGTVVEVAEIYPFMD